MRLVDKKEGFRLCFVNFCVLPEEGRRSGGQNVNQTVLSRIFIKDHVSLKCLKARNFQHKLLLLTISRYKQPICEIIDGF